MKPERYLVFAGRDYYPRGGWDDLIGSYADPYAAGRAASEYVKKDQMSWSSVIDLETGTEIANFHREY